ncbi:LysR substrate-binding domain-containing protein [Nocardioides piscis]|uniref:LysR family transcriptional regulator n=1 Tax=Nocardioides piscis TaxID=2714938 RepID=A0A6G7YIJ1_9ACTN|nr:LysR substrate-binding domain-containing protein [Nocardioides piscis]QIK76557.1 LysR family transcriptional regulator [Nocardioides piscis]
MSEPFRVGFVTGSTPDKWARAWRERRRVPLELVPVLESEQEIGLREETLDMALVRLPIDREGLHCVRLYAEVPVVVAGVDHFVAAAEEVTLADLTDEQLVRPHASGWQPDASQLDWPPMSEKDAIETVAAGTGVVIVPMSIARLHMRKDVVHRPVTDLDPTEIALAWRIERDAEDTQAFVGLARGRSANSSR